MPKQNDIQDAYETSRSQTPVDYQVRSQKREDQAQTIWQYLRICLGLVMISFFMIYLMFATAIVISIILNYLGLANAIAQDFLALNSDIIELISSISFLVVFSSLVIMSNLGNRLVEAVKSISGQ